MANTSETQSAEEFLKRIEALEREISGLKKILEEGADNQVSKMSSHIPLWILIRDYLRAEGGSASPRDIADALVEEGHDLGKYPLRNVKITLTTPAMRPIFKVTKSANGHELVFLVNKATIYAPRDSAGVRARSMRVSGKHKPRS
jgi:hypothetical protein